MIKNRVILTVVALVFVSCAHGKTEHFPSMADPLNAAEITVIRNRNLFGLGFSLRLALDGQDIAFLRAGEYVSFFVDPGVHTVGTSASSVAMPFAPGQKYYFLVSAVHTSFGFEIEQVDDQEATQWITDSKPLQ